jgi:hypothetical protein
MALAMARNYFLSGRNEAHVLPYVGDKQPELGLAHRLFAEAAANQVSTHAAFVTEVLLECAPREGTKLDKPPELVMLCFARVDIPFFLDTWRKAQVAKQAATARAENALKHRTFIRSG